MESKVKRRARSLEEKKTPSNLVAGSKLVPTWSHMHPLPLGPQPAGGWEDRQTDRLGGSIVRAGPRAVCRAGRNPSQTTGSSFNCWSKARLFWLEVSGRGIRRASQGLHYRRYDWYTVNCLARGILDERTCRVTDRLTGGLKDIMTECQAAVISNWLTDWLF